MPNLWKQIKYHKNITKINELLHMKQSGICYETLIAEDNRKELPTLIDEVRSHCQYFGIRDVNTTYTHPKILKKKIFEASMNKLWISLLMSKKAPWSPRRPEEKTRFYFSLPKHQAKCALLYETGELNFRTNRKQESLREFGTLECVVPSCCELDTLEHAKGCHGYSTQYRDNFSPLEWVKYLSDLDIERFSKYKTSFTRFKK